MNILLVKTITKVNNKKIILPNSVNVFNNKIIITDSGNNRVCIIAEKEEYTIGKDFGIGKYKFKEPVYSSITSEFVFVCDWHNHRIVLFKDENFYQQIGIFGKTKSSKIANIIRLFLSFRSTGSFDYSHFDISYKKSKDTSIISYTLNTLQGIAYYIVNRKILINNLKESAFINKPNGCILIDEKLYYTQKDNKCVTIYDIKQNKVLRQIDNSTKDINFGRLGQIAEFNGLIYVCDETNNKIWIFNINLDYIKFISITEYNIFSITFNEKYIATCGENGFTIFNHEFEILYEKIGDGEYHGVFLNKDNLYVVNRLKHQIEEYKLLEGIE